MSIILYLNINNHKTMYYIWFFLSITEGPYGKIPKNLHYFIYCITLIWGSLDWVFVKILFVFRLILGQVRILGLF